MKKLTDAEIQASLKDLPSWTLKDGKLHRQYTFSDFLNALEFMVKAAAPIQRMNHHPEWSNVYSRVTVDLTTHDAGGITAKDLDLAMLLEGIAKKLA